jgi:hypothetical protein
MASDKIHIKSTLFYRYSFSNKVIDTNSKHQNSDFLKIHRSIN